MQKKRTHGGGTRAAHLKLRVKRRVLVFFFFFFLVTSSSALPHISASRVTQRGAHVRDYRSFFVHFWIDFKKEKFLQMRGAKLGSSRLSVPACPLRHAPQWKPQPVLISGLPLPICLTH